MYEKARREGEEEILKTRGMVGESAQGYARSHHRRLFGFREVMMDAFRMQALEASANHYTCRPSSRKQTRQNSNSVERSTHSELTQ